MGRRDQTESEMRDLYHGYRDTLDSDLRALLDQFRYVHLARKAVGVGSVGTRDWIVLFLGVDSQDPLFLQIKEAQPSVLERFVGKSEYSNHGQRVVAGQRSDCRRGRGTTQFGAEIRWHRPGMGK